MRRPSSPARDVAALSGRTMSPRLLPVPRAGRGPAPGRATSRPRARRAAPLRRTRSGGEPTASATAVSRSLHCAPSRGRRGPRSWWCRDPGSTPLCGVGREPLRAQPGDAIRNLAGDRDAPPRAPQSRQHDHVPHATEGPGLDGKGGFADCPSTGSSRARSAPGASGYPNAPPGRSRKRCARCSTTPYAPNCSTRTPPPPYRTPSPSAATSTGRPGSSTCAASSSTGRSSRTGSSRARCGPCRSPRWHPRRSPPSPPGSTRRSCSPASRAAT